MRLTLTLCVIALLFTVSESKAASLKDEDDDIDDIYSARYAKNKAALEQAKKSPIDEVVDSLKPYLPASLHDKVKKFDIEARLTRLNGYLKDLIKEINLMGVPDPLDHFVFVFIFWFGIYVPTKMVYSFLDIFYGSSSDSGTPYQPA